VKPPFWYAGVRASVFRGCSAVPAMIPPQG
jgi:hypothetical protein